MKYNKLLYCCFVFLLFSMGIYAQTGNNQPTADAGADRNVVVSEQTILFGTGSDEDEDSITFKWQLVDKPGGSLSTLSKDSIPNPTFMPDIEGVYVFSLRTNDGQVFSTASNVVITANSKDTTNSRPVAYPGPDRNINVDEETTVGGFGFDKNGDSLIYMWSILSSPSKSKALLSEFDTPSPIFKPDLIGKYQLGFVVNDGKRDSALVKVDIVSSNPDTNRAPSADAGSDKVIRFNRAATLSGNGFDSDNDELRFSWSVISKPLGSQAILSDNNIPNPGFTPDVDGIYIFSLTVDDAQLDSIPDEIKYNATDADLANNRPTANAGADRSINVGEEVSLSGSGSDQDSDTITFRWSIISLPQNSGAYLSNPNVQDPFFTPDKEGEYVLQLITNDGKEDSNPDTINIESTITGEECAVQGTCDVEKKQWCNNGFFTSVGYCEKCNNQDSSCETCTGNICDVSNEKWCEDGYWKEGTDSQYCSHCNYADSSCPLCIDEICDTFNNRWCDEGIWSIIDYCDKCGDLDSYCMDDCKNSTCDIKNKKWCGGGVWETSNYCIQCGSKDSSCASECSDGACDIKNKKWCDDGAWSEEEYCYYCGDKDFSCDLTCKDNTCDVVVNRWCDSESWTPLNYCDHCQDSECLNTCVNNACDINTKKWCNKNMWSDINYCDKCGTKDSSCLATCEEDICDTVHNERCSDETWTSNNYCNYCALEDSDCTITCADGECDTTYKKVCRDGGWANESYCSSCASVDTSCGECLATEDDCCLKISDDICDPDCESYSDQDCENCDSSEDDCCFPKRDDICDPDCAIDLDSDCVEISCLGNGTCETGDSCTKNSHCLSNYCLDGECSEEKCSDSIKNGNETDVDCGGNSCSECLNDEKCITNSDCGSDYCFYSICKKKPTCSDGILNGNETDVDCGGVCANKCEQGQHCVVNSDCGYNLECDIGTCIRIEGSSEAIPDTDEDTDKDGIPDKWELEYNLSISDPTDAQFDFDGDGLTNLQEYAYRTNPNRMDTDEDGVSDKEEINKDTDPLDPVSKPGGIGGMLILVVVLTIIFGAGSYVFYYYRHVFKTKVTEQSPALSYLPKKEYTQKKSNLNEELEKERIEEAIRKKRRIKEDERKRIFEAFDTRTKFNIKPKGKKIRKMARKDVFSKLKRIYEEEEEKRVKK